MIKWFFNIKLIKLWQSCFIKGCFTYALASFIIMTFFRLISLWKKEIKNYQNSGWFILEIGLLVSDICFCQLFFDTSYLKILILLYLGLQKAFDKDWENGAITYTECYPNATSDGKLAWRLLLGTGEPHETSQVQ